MGGGVKRKQERGGLVCELGEDGMAKVSSTTSAYPASTLEWLGLECRDAVDGMGLTLEPPLPLTTLMILFDARVAPMALSPVLL